MASELKVDKFTGVTTAGSITVQGEGTNTTNLQQGLGKCWINAAIRSTYATRDSFNCSVTTDHGAGEVTYSYTNNFSNNDYVISHMSKQTAGEMGGIGFPAVSAGGNDADDAENAMTTSTCRWQYRNTSGQFRDQEIAGHIWMGDLA